MKKTVISAHSIGEDLMGLARTVSDDWRTQEKLLCRMLSAFSDEESSGDHEPEIVGYCIHDGVMNLKTKCTATITHGEAFSAAVIAAYPNAKVEFEGAEVWITIPVKEFL